MRYVRDHVGLLVSLFIASHASAMTSRPQVDAYARQILPDVLGMVPSVAMLTSRPVQYLSIAYGKDEYIYSFSDKVFIRRQENRWELPAWRVCGDFALVRVELLGENMNTVAPIMAWPLLYREGRWERLSPDESGTGLRRSDSRPVELPPYAVRCFNLDRREILDR